ncbi:MAG: lasso peptide biosynthesis B2 protein [Methanobacteriaceae archaeon]|nr:lasso peptide biosynthesis B2 protein [Methanobacteriaceae archaeon]
MIPLKSFIKLPFPEKTLALRALYWVIYIRVILWIFPFNYVKKRVQQISRVSSPANGFSHNSTSFSLPRISFMVRMASRYVLRATCLVQALAGHILFSKYGYDTQIKIGVSSEDGQFEAHAWLEREGDVVLGESEKDYKTILDVNSGSQLDNG